MGRKWIAGIAAALALLVIAYAGSPYLAARNLREAAISADVDKLDTAVDFPAVRDSLKSQVSAAMTKRVNDDPGMKDNPFAGLGMMLMPTIVDRMVDTLVTPDGISALIRQGRPGADAAAGRTPNPDITYRYSYVGIDRFRVRMVNRKRDEPMPSLIFERRGLFSWKLIRLELPDTLFDRHGAATQ
jgi:hypothetical protein